MAHNVQVDASLQGVYTIIASWAQIDGLVVRKNARLQAAREQA